MRGVILAGGKGTRMSPSTKVTNKHLLPVYSEKGAVPMIFYPIRTLVQSGITDILIISSREHCGHIIENLGDGYGFGADFSYKIQDHKRVQLGIASALKLARNFVNGENFAVILGDNFYEDTFEPQVNQWDKGGHVGFNAAVFLKETDEIERFGCATLIKHPDENQSSHVPIAKIVEKPKNPESNWAVTGLYFYTPQVFEVAETLKPSHRGELEITDINNHYCPDLLGIKLQGFWSDMGTPTSMAHTQEFMLHHNF